MAQDTIWRYFKSWFFETTVSRDEKTQRYFELARRYTEQAQGISSRSCALRPRALFNFRQCEYLAEKLKLAVESAHSFFVQIKREHFSFPEPGNVGNRLEIFKLLLVLSQEVENFIQDCCKDEWIQAVVLSSNVSGHISSLGFHLELCTVLFEYESKRKSPRRSLSLTEVDDILKVEGFQGLRFSGSQELARTSSGFHLDLCTGPFYERKKKSARRSLTLTEVDGIFKTEAQVVKKPASLDMETLLTDLDVVRETRKEASSQYQMAALMFERLERSRLMAAGDPPESSSSNLSETVFSSVKQFVSLGKGSAATVYEATWHGAKVAMKVFEGPNNHDFQKEVSVLEGLSHPNIISVFCSTIGNRKSSIVMELMDRDLYSLMQARCELAHDQNPFGILEGVDIMLQIGGGMSYLHEMRIVHRDLKSMNILVRSLKTSELKYVVAKVADFGLSKMKENSMTYTIQTQNMGTTRWMAPEMLKSQNDESQIAESQKERADGEAMIINYPFKCDIYSFGMVCYEILTGYQPFFNVFPVTNVKRMVLEGKRPELPDQCPDQLKSLIERCWSSDAGKRPSFGDICAELRHLKYALLMKCRSFFVIALLTFTDCLDEVTDFHGR